MAKYSFKEELKALKDLKKAGLINDRSTYLSVVGSRLRTSKPVKFIRRQHGNYLDSKLRHRILSFWTRTKICYGLLQWVNTYTVERHYGGPEEGGWWYNSLDCIDSKLTFRWKAEGIAKRYKEGYKSLAYGNIYSVLGGREVEVYVEDQKAQSETVGRPIYC